MLKRVTTWSEITLKNVYLVAYILYSRKSEITMIHNAGFSSHCRRIEAWEALKILHPPIIQKRTRIKCVRKGSIYSPGCTQCVGCVATECIDRVCSNL